MGEGVQAASAAVETELVDTVGWGHHSLPQQESGWKTGRGRFASDGGEGDIPEAGNAALPIETRRSKRRRRRRRIKSTSICQTAASLCLSVKRLT